MPIAPCQRAGKSGRRWGGRGRCYTGPGAAKKAARQAAAARANGWTGHAATDGASGRAAAHAKLTAAVRRQIPAADYGDPTNRKFPVRGQKDLDDAAHLIGKAANPEVVKRRLLGIARRKGLKVPAAWKQMAAHAERFSEGGTLKGVEIFKAGIYRGKRYTVADLRAMVRNFERHSAGSKPLVRVPAVIGHEEDQEFLQRSDLPAAGWWTRLYVEGDTLKGDCAEIPPQVARLLNSHAYRTVSAEIYDEPPEGVPGRGKMLRRVAFLGGELPQVKELGDIPTVEEHAERRQAIGRVALVPVTDRLFRRPRAGSFIAFCECKKMADRDCQTENMADDTGDDLEQLDPADILKKLADCGFDTSVFDDLSDSDLRAVASEILRVYTSEHSPDDDAGAGHDDEAEHGHPDDDDDQDDDDQDDDLDDDDPDDDDDDPRRRHDDMEEYEEDMEEFDQSASDRAMWAKVDETGTSRSKSGRYNQKQMNSRSKKLRALGHKNFDDMNVGATTPEPTSMGQPPKKVTVNKTMHFREKGGKARPNQVRRQRPAPRVFSFAEVKKLVSTIVGEAVGQARAEIKKELGGVKKHVSRYEADRKKAAVEAFCEKNLKAGKILPSELDRADPANLFDELLRADATTVVRKFKEGKKELALTELDLKMRQVERRQPRFFGERFKDPKAADGRADSKEARKDWAEQTFTTFSESFKTVGTSKEDFLKEVTEASDERFTEIKKNWDRHGR